MIFNEAYYGKNDVLVKCEALFDKAMTTKTGYKEIKEIESLLQKLFNFKKLLISIIPVGLAVTFPITVYKLSHISNKLELEKSKDGIAFKTSDDVEAIIFIDIISMATYKLTGAECVAILLHEIGHSMNFVMPHDQILNSVRSIMLTATIFGMVISVGKSGFLTNNIQKIDMLYNSIMEKFRKRTIADISSNTSFSKSLFIYNMYSRLKRTFPKFNIDDTLLNNIISGIKHNIIKSTIMSTDGAYNIAIGMAGFITRIFGYKSEIFSDYISTTFGYGQYIASSMAKLDIASKKMSYDNALFRLIRLPFNIINVLFDPHPKNISRIKLIIENLENELKKSINESSYAEIKKDLDVTKDILDNFEKELFKDKISNIDIILFRKLIGRFIDGHDDIRAVFFGLKPNDMKALDDLEKLPVVTNDPTTLQECAGLMMEMSHLSKKEKDNIIELLTDK